MRLKLDDDLELIFRTRSPLFVKAAAFSMLAMSLYALLRQDGNMLLWVVGALVVVCLLFAVLIGIEYAIARQRRNQIDNAKSTIHSLLTGKRSSAMAKAIGRLEREGDTIPEIKIALDDNRKSIDARLVLVRHQEQLNRDTRASAGRADRIREIFASLHSDVRKKADEAYRNHPALRSVAKVEAAIKETEAAKARIEQQWEFSRAKFSWWQHLTVSGPDLAPLDQHIKSLEMVRGEIRRRITASKLREHLENGVDRARTRIEKLQSDVLRTVPKSHDVRYDYQAISKAALFLSAASIPVSIWNDAARAGDVYEALRGVSEKYAAMSDHELWLHCLTMNGQSLAGLAALTKGAYFETLVANDTGGTLHEHFNHPDTDIMIDGVAYQIKATDSVDYIQTVEEGIPIIATSDVAGVQGAIGTGYADEDLERAVDLALGGMVIDVSDTAFDAVLAPLGVFGVVATLRGAHHVIKQYNAGEGAVGSLAAGVGVAATSAAKTAVGTAELTYKVATSGPVRFVGRAAMKMVSGSGTKGDISPAAARAERQHQIRRNLADRRHRGE